MVDPTPTSTTTVTEPPADPAGRRLLIVFHEEVLGGATISVLRLLPGLEAAGWEPSFWVPRPSPLADELEARGLRVRGAPRPVAYSLAGLRLPPGPGARLAAMPAYVRAYLRELRSLRPALVHANSLTTLLEGSLARCSRIPVVMHVHEMLGERRKARFAAAAVHAVGTEVVAVSAASAAGLTLGRRRPRVVHECVPVPGRASRGRPRDDRPLVVGSVGVISRRKGTDLFVEAAAHLAGRKDLRFELIGAPTDPLDADWARPVLERAAEVGVEHSLRGDVGAALARWDIFALPSRRDPFPIALLEAMAAGLPVIGSRRDGIEEMLSGSAGILCAPDDSGSLAVAIEELADSEQLRAKLGEAARTRVGERYTLAHQLEGMLDTYRAAVGP